MAVSDYVKNFFEPTPDVRTRDVLREIPGTISSAAGATRRFLLPSRAEEFERMQQEAQQSLRFTPELGQEIDRRIGAMGPGAATLEQFLSQTPVDPFGVVGRTGAVFRRTGKALINRISKETSEDAVKVFLRESGLDLSEGVVNKFAPRLTKISDPNTIAKVINLAIKESPVSKQAAKKISDSISTRLTRERGYVTSARKVVPTAEKLGGQYVPRATNPLAIKARNLVSENAFEAERIVREEPLSDRTVALGSELIKKLGDDIAAETDLLRRASLEDKVATIANDLATRLTEVGRTIQAASILGRLTPEGQLRFAAKEIQKFNIKNPGRKIPELTGEQSAYILNQSKEILALPDGLDKAKRWQKLQDYISDLVPTPFIKKAVATWKAGLLTGIKTSGLNLFSNLTHFASEIAKDAPAAVVDSAAALFTGERTKTLTVRRAFDGIKEGSIKGVRYFATGFDERNVGAKIDYKRVNFGKGKVAKVFQVYTDTVFRALAVGDQPFYYATLARSLMDQSLAVAKNKGLKGKQMVEEAYKLAENPTEDMLRAGVSDAATAVFINDTAAGRAARQVQTWFGGVGEFIIPFGRTPSAVAMQAIAYSPVGAAASIIRNIGKGRFNQRDFSQGLGRGLSGTALLTIGMELAKNDRVAPAYPVGDEKEQKLQEAEGVKNGYILVDDKWRSPLVLGPAGVVVQAGGLLQQALETEGGPTDAAVKAFATAGKAFLELPFLTGLEDAINAISNPERYAKSYLPGLIASFVPTIISDVARATDPEERRTSAPSLIETIGTRVKSRIPGLRKNLEPRVNILGYPVERAGNVVEVMFDPTRPSKTMETPVTIEFRRLHDEGFRVSPTALGNKNGYEVLSAPENTRLWQITGTLIDQKVTALIANEAYANADDSDRAKAIDKIVEKSKEVARATMVVELTVGLEGEELSKKLSELKEGKLITKAVYKKYLEIR